MLVHGGQLKNFEPSIAPAHNTLCVAVGGSCISETTSFADEAKLIGNDGLTGHFSRKVAIDILIHSTI